MKITIIFLLVIISFIRCPYSERQACFDEGSQTGQQDCSGAILVYGISEPEDKLQSFNLMMVSCLKEYQADKKCKEKSNYIPTIRWN